MRNTRRKDKRTYRTTLYLDEDLIEELRRIAFEERTTMTELINQAIFQFLKNYKRRKE